MPYFSPFPIAKYSIENLNGQPKYVMTTKEEKYSFVAAGDGGVIILDISDK